MKILHNGGIVEPHPLHNPILPNAFTPPGTNVFNEGIPRPLTPGDYNGVPLTDAEFLHQSRHMDQLHRSDLTLTEFQRGENLKSVAKSLGTEKFKRIYETFKK